MSTQEVLATCDFFVDPRARRTLFLGLPNRAVLTELADPSDPADILSSKRLKEARGTFAIDDANKTVRVQVGGVDAEYHVMEPQGLSECALIRGPLTSADYLGSWFGQVDDSDIDREREPW